MAAEVDCFDVSVEDVSGLVEFKDQSIDLVVVGPEIPPSLGLVDALKPLASLLTVLGVGAQLESSKAFCKDFFARHNIPTATMVLLLRLKPRWIIWINIRRPL